ncbi:MAG TPA: TspO/MBR family protein [Ignavibacteria bacterium]
MNWIKLISSIVICQIVGIIGSFFTAKNIPVWYAGLKKPVFNPPNWVFAPVWITLYLLMGVSFYLIWIKSAEKDIKIPVILFIAQLILNSFWTIIFFGLKSPGFALFEILILWILILLCIIEFYPVSVTASLLLIPYILWVTYASILNYSLWRLN